MPISSTAIRILLIDNYDSYTHNLVHLFSKVTNGAEATVVRADAFPSFRALTKALGDFDAIVISPGPGTPHSHDDFASLPADTLRQRYIPVFGVCLGHQALCVAYGAKVILAPAGPVHGRLSTMQLDLRRNCPLWDGIPQGFQVVRYHSLVVDPMTLPCDIVPTAWTTDDSTATLMAAEHARFPLFGVQFHPESISTEYGEQIASNFAGLAKRLKNARAIPWLSMRDRSIPKPKLRIPEKKSDRSERENVEGLQAIVRSIDHVNTDTQELFSRLYQDNVPSFWLDSSTSCASASSLSRCSSPGSSPGSSSISDEIETSRGRFSIMGGAEGPRAEIITYNTSEKCVRILSRHSGIWNQRKKACSIFQYLNEQLRNRNVSCPDELPLEMNGGYVGFFGYELKKEVPGVSVNNHSSELPDAWFLFADRVVILDHETYQAYLVAVVALGPGTESETENANKWFSSVEQKILSDPCLPGDSYGAQCHSSRLSPSLISPNAQEPLSFNLERSKSDYIRDIRACLREIIAGESYEICLTNRLRARVQDTSNLDPFSVYCALRLVNPAPYSAFLRLSKDIAICCSSPERFIKISSDGFVESKPIKGTAKRGDSLESDERLRNELAKSVKDRSENLMIVDLVRNDLGQTCQMGSISVPRLMHVESYATVHQLVSTVRGNLAEGRSSVDCIRAAYPMGSMTGAPKVRTLDIIDRIECSARGAYSGSLGYLSLCGAADLNVVIRTAVLNGPNIEIGSGGAIVALSNAEAEFFELFLKAQGVMHALALAITGKSEYVITGM